MTKRKPLVQEEVRARRDRLIDTAIRAQLSLTDGLREMRAISGLTQEAFAEHRGVSTRVVKALELGQGNPTVATLNRIADVFGLEVAFVPGQRLRSGEPHALTGSADLVNSLIQLEAAVADQHERLKKIIGDLHAGK